MTGIDQVERLQKCPHCKRGCTGFDDLAYQIDQRGIAKCPNCNRVVTREVLYAYWDEKPKRAQAVEKASSAKQWWQFWK